MSIFRFYHGLKSSFEKSVCKNLILSACSCWDSTLSSLRMDQHFKLARTIDYGDSYLEFFFHRFKVFRLHAVLQDPAGAVRAHSGKGSATVTWLKEDQIHVCLVT